MINSFQNNFESNENLRCINGFYESYKNLPKEPSYKSNKNYVEELQIYQSKMEAYFTSFCVYLHDSCNQMNGITEDLKNAYYTLYDEFKAYSKYIKKGKHVNQGEIVQIPEDGSMSPSNPFYTIFESDVTSENVEIKNGNDENPINDEQGDYFLKYFHDKIKVVKRYLRKDKRQMKRKLSKNQKKKFKKRLKLQGNVEINQPDLTISENNEEDPQVIIQEYFKSYNETGEWSWTQWLSSIKKIQQNNPLWFEIFSRFSIDMGINWNEMFMSDLQAIDQTNVRIDIDNLDLPNKPNVNFQLTGDSKEGTSVLFTNDIKPNETGESNKSELYCEVCNQEFRSARFFHIHLRGLKHAQNEIMHVSKQKPDIFLEEINKENACVINDLSKEDKHVKWLLNNEDISKESATYTCKICNVSCTSQKDFKNHLNGEKHATNAVTESSPKVLISDEKKIENISVPKSKKKPVAKIQGLINQRTEPLIGLNYVNEYQKLDSSSHCWYYCELCSYKCDQKSIIIHVISYKHRVTYLKHNYYDLYELIEQDPSSKSVREKRLEVYSDQVELHEGRKNINIFIEKKCFTEVITDNFKLPCSSLQQTETSIIPILEEQNQEEKINFTNEKLIPDDQSELNIEIIDKEDGEIESSDDESSPTECKSENICDILSTKLSPKKQTFVELEAGEIENEILDEIQDIDEDIDNQDLVECADAIIKTVVSKAEFDNYNPLYVNDRPPSNVRDTSSGDCRIEFMKHNKDKKKVKLKEVTDDILNHFKQQAVWALNRLKQNTSVHINKNLHLPPSKNPVGPIYPGVSELANNSISDSETKFMISNEDNCLSPETEFTNIVERIESITSTKLSSNRSLINNNSIDNSLLHDVQNMLVNKVTNDRLNEVVRQEFLFSSIEQEYFELVSSSSHESNRKHILNSPINSKLLNETVETLQNMIDNSPDISNLSETVTSDSPKVGDKMSKQFEFLGVNQPPPPHFPKINTDYYYKVPTFSHMPISVPPFYTTGMIEHRAAFSNSNFIYPYPYLSHGNNPKGVRYFK